MCIFIIKYESLQIFHTYEKDYDYPKFDDNR